MVENIFSLFLITKTYIIMEKPFTIQKKILIVFTNLFFKIKILIIKKNLLTS